jgi:hypothetical protein
MCRVLLALAGWLAACPVLRARAVSLVMPVLRALAVCPLPVTLRAFPLVLKTVPRALSTAMRLASWRAAVWKLPEERILVAALKFAEGRPALYVTAKVAVTPRRGPAAAI